MLPEHKLAKALYSKSIMTDYLAHTDLVPKSFVLKKDLSNLKEIESTLGYPFWIRSTSGSMGMGSLKIENSDMLKNWLFINPHIDEFFASEFLPGRNLASKMLY